MIVIMQTSRLVFVIIMAAALAAGACNGEEPPGDLGEKDMSLDVTVDKSKPTEQKVEKDLPDKDLKTDKPVKDLPVKDLEPDKPNQDILVEPDKKPDLPQPDLPQPDLPVKVDLPLPPDMPITKNDLPINPPDIPLKPDQPQPDLQQPDLPLPWDLPPPDQKLPDQLALDLPPPPPDQTPPDVKPPPDVLPKDYLPHTDAPVYTSTWHPRHPRHLDTGWRLAKKKKKTKATKDTP